MPETMSETNPNEEESGDQAVLEEDGDAAPRKTPSTGARLWDRVRGRLLRPKVKTGTVSCGWTGDVPALFLFFFVIRLSSAPARSRSSNKTCFH